MFCPQCGQQSSDEIRFCPRCGLSLVPHATLLASGGAAAGAVVAQQAPVRTRRRVQMRRAAKLMWFSFVLLPVFIGLSIANDGGEPLLLPLISFMVGVAWLFYARLFIDDTYAARKESRKDLKAGAESPALGAAQFNPAPLFGRQRADTAEIYQPPSVTEHTTKLLDRDS